MTTKTINSLKKWDIQEHLESPEDIALFLEAVFEDGDPQLVAAALGEVARAKGMTRVAREAGVTREALYKALSINGAPKLATLMGVFNALGLRVSFKTSDKKGQQGEDMKRYIAG